MKQIFSIKYHSDTRMTQKLLVQEKFRLFQFVVAIITLIVTLLSFLMLAMTIGICSTVRRIVHKFRKTGSVENNNRVQQRKSKTNEKEY